MVQFQMNVRVFLFQPFIYGLGEEDGTVLPARAAKRNHQIAEMAFDVIVNALAHNAFHMVEEDMDERLGHEVVDDFPVAASLGLELGFAAWVGQGAAVEHEAASVATEVVGVAFFEGEAVYCDGEFGVES